MDQSKYLNFSNNHQKLLINWFYPQNPESQKHFIDDIIDYNDPVLSFDSISKEFYLKSSSYKNSLNKFSFKLEELLIDSYNDPNDVQIFSNKKIFSGKVSVSFKYTLINESPKKDSKFSYIGF